MKTGWVIILVLMIPTACIYRTTRDSSTVGIITRDGKPVVMDNTVLTGPGNAMGSTTVDGATTGTTGDAILDNIITETLRGITRRSKVTGLSSGGTLGNTTAGIPSILPGGTITGITSGVPTDCTLPGITSSFPAGGTTTGTTGTITLGGTAMVNSIVPGGTIIGITSSFPAHGTTTGITGNIALGGTATTIGFPPACTTIDAAGSIPAASNPINRVYPGGTTGNTHR